VLYQKRPLKPCTCAPLRVGALHTTLGLPRTYLPSMSESADFASGESDRETLDGGVFSFRHVRICALGTSK
jgi:hypothetical protein